MSKVVVKTLSEKSKRANQIPIGTYFFGQWQHYSGLFVRSYNHISSVEDPSRVWDPVGFEVENYRPVDVEIHVKEMQ